MVPNEYALIVCTSMIDDSIHSTYCHLFCGILILYEVSLIACIHYTLIHQPAGSLPLFPSHPVATHAQTTTATKLTHTKHPTLRPHTIPPATKPNGIDSNSSNDDTAVISPVLNIHAILKLLVLTAELKYRCLTDPLTLQLLSIVVKSCQHPFVRSFHSSQATGDTLDFILLN